MYVSYHEICACHFFSIAHFPRIFIANRPSALSFNFNSVKTIQIRFYNAYLKLQKYKSSHHCFKLGLQKQYRIWFNYDGERDREKQMYLIFEAYACLWTSW